MNDKTYCVHFLGFVGDLGGLLALDVALLELRKETTPILLGELRVLGKFAFDHKFLLQSR